MPTRNSTAPARRRRRCGQASGSFSLATILDSVVKTKPFSPTEPRTPSVSAAWAAIHARPDCGGASRQIAARQFDHRGGNCLLSVGILDADGCVSQDADHRSRTETVRELEILHRGEQDRQGLGQGRRRAVARRLDAVEIADHQHGVDLHRRMKIAGNQLFQRLKHQVVEMIVNLAAAVSLQMVRQILAAARQILATSFCNDHRDRK